MPIRTDPEPQTFPTAGPLRLDVELAAGELLVDADLDSDADDPCEVLIEALDPDNGSAVTFAHHVVARLVGDRLEVRCPARGWRRHPALRVRVRAPAGSDLAASTGSAEVRTTGSLAGLRLRTASGSLRADRVTGEVEVKSASGDVLVGDVGGNIDVRTASGDVSVGAIGAARLRVTTASGQVQVGVKAGTPVRFDVLSASGQVRSTLDPLAAPEPGESELLVRVRSASGPVTVARALAEA